MKRYTLLACLLFVGKLFAFEPKAPIDIQWTVTTFDLGTIAAGETTNYAFDTLTVGEGAQGLTFLGVQSLGVLPIEFRTNLQRGQLLQPGRIPYSIEFETPHAINAPYVLALNFSSNGHIFSILKEIKFTGAYGDKYSSLSPDAYDSQLIDELKKFVEGHTSLSYKDARTLMFSQIDNAGGEVECVYTGRRIQASGIPDVTTTHFNTEHTWPQSLGAENEPEKSDLFHIRPTDEQANSVRANYPFGYAASSITYNSGGSKFGRDSAGKQVFEVRDERKGDIARGMFYFALRYGNKSDYLTGQEIDLRKYSEFDPPDDIERDRNLAIESAQGKTNPFIDHPELLRRIYSLSGKTPPNEPVLQLSDTLIKVSKGSSGSSKTSFVVYNSSAAEAQLLSWSVEAIDATASPIFEPSNFSIPARGFVVFDIDPPTNVSGSGSSTIELSFSGVDAPLKLRYQWGGTLSAAGGDLQPLDVYPNPFSERLIVKSVNDSRVEIYDLFGLSVYSEVGGKTNGNYEIPRVVFGAPGVYVLRITTKNGTAVRKLIAN
ncbi:MAG: endonuclease [Chloroflexota bacterium]